MTGIKSADKISVFAYSRSGAKTAERVKDALIKTDHSAKGLKIRLFTVKRLKALGFELMEEPYKETYREEFSSSAALIFVGALGIAVRNIAPFIKDKKTDPAVICIDEKGSFVIPVLSGHIGGANELSEVIAKEINAEAVITTATDINGRFAADAWAGKNGCFISDMKAAKAVSAAILERDIPVVCDLPVSLPYPPGTYAYSGNKPEDIGICISIFEKQPFDTTLLLVPRILHLGIGCRKGMDKETIAKAVREIFEQNNLSFKAVKGVYSIDLKADEPGLISFCKEAGLKLTTYTAEELNEVEGCIEGSELVKKVTGTDNVCERAALKDAARILVHKTVSKGVTAAVAAEDLIVCF